MLEGIYAQNSNMQCFTHRPKFNRNKDTSTLSTQMQRTEPFSARPDTSRVRHTLQHYAVRVVPIRTSRENADTRCDTATQEDATCLDTGCLSTSMSLLNVIIQLSDYVRDALQI